MSHHKLTLVLTNPLPSPYAETESLETRVLDDFARIYTPPANPAFPDWIVNGLNHPGHPPQP
jgi:hypothetical protein